MKTKRAVPKRTRAIPKRTTKTIPARKRTIAKKTKKVSPTGRRRMIRGRPASAIEESFAEIAGFIARARQSAVQAVNTALIDLYWQVGEAISRKIEADGWGRGTVGQLARFIRRQQPGIRGFSPQNLWRMRQFFDAYRVEPKLSPLVRELPWTHNLIILTQSKRPDERASYLRMAVRERWSKRDLERQLRLALFEHTVLHPAKVSAALTQIHGATAGPAFKDAYFVEFLDLPKSHTEDDLHRGLLARLRDFLVELGSDFCFVGSEYPLQVGGRDFALDLLLFHRGLNCLVAVELKVDRFEPEYLGKLEFYLEVLDRDHRKPHENPAIGVLLCASRDREVVEYALSRSLSPALIAEYQTQLPDKKLLAAKLHEFYALDAADESTGGPAKRANKGGRP